MDFEIGLMGLIRQPLNRISSRTENRLKRPKSREKQQDRPSLISWKAAFCCLKNYLPFVAFQISTIKPKIKKLSPISSSAVSMASSRS